MKLKKINRRIQSISLAIERARVTPAYKDADGDELVDLYVVCSRAYDEANPGDRLIYS